MGRVTYLAAAVVFAGVMLYPYTDPKQPKAISSLSPKFDGRDQGSRGDYFQAPTNGLWLYHISWIPDGAIKGVVVIFHGYGEHVERYDTFAKTLNAAGYAVYGLDHQGHGKSEGDRAYVEHFQHFVKDGLHFVETIVRPANKDKPLFLLGHSMGGQIALHAVVQKPKLFSGLVTSSPALMVDPNIATPTMVKISRSLSSIVPKLPLPGNKLDSSGISELKDVVAAYDADPLIYHGSIRARFGYEFLESASLIAKQIKQIKMPLFGFHGKGDKLAMVESTQLVKDEASSTDKTFMIVESKSHELYHELKYQEATVEWLNKHT